MDVGNPLLFAASIFSIGAALAGYLSRKRGGDSMELVASALGVAAFISITAALTLLVWMASGSDFTYRYVWAHSSVEMEQIYRISSVWAAGEGALLLSAWFIGLVLAVETFYTRRRTMTGGGFRSCFRATLSVLLFIFSIMVISVGMFDRTSQTDLTMAPGGIGMDFSLRTPEMVFHAPVIFGAYACLAALFAASIAHLLTGERNWTDAGLFWGRLGWLLLTAGIAIGAVWAYYVIGWGGYWAWDPIETASLLPWLMATAFLHTQMRHSSLNEYRLASPAFGMLSFVGVVFVSFIVRAGGLWQSSVHDYGSSTASSAISRFISLLGEEPSVAGTFAFMSGLILLSIVAILFARRTTRRKDAPSLTISKLSEHINDRDIMFLAVVIFSATSLLALILLFKNMESDQGSMYVEFNQKMSILFVVLMVTMSVCLTWRLIGREEAFWAAIAILSASVSLALISTFLGWSDPLVAFSLPSYLVATACSAAKLVTVVLNGSVLDRLHRGGAQIVHIGIAFVLIGFVASSNLQSFPAQGYEVAMPVTGELRVGDYTLRLVSVEVSGEVSSYPEGVAQVRTANLEVSRNGKVVEESACPRILYGLDPTDGYYVLEIVPYVRTAIDGDLYLSYEWMSEDIVLIHAKIVPVMWLLWVGAMLLCIGISIRIFSLRSEACQRTS